MPLPNTQMHPIIEEDIRAIVSRSGIAWQDLSGQTLLLAGANGFLPSYMADTIAYLNDHVLSKPCQLIALTRSPCQPGDRLGHLLGRPDVQFITADVAKPFSIPEGVTYLVHGASPASPKIYTAKPIETMDANVNGLRAMLDYARSHPVRSILFISSGAVYGDAPPEQIPTPETFAGNVPFTSERSCYAETKRYCESLCANFHRVHGTPVKMARPFHNYGPGLRLDDGRVVADFLADAIEGRPITVRSAGTTLLTYSYVADTAEAFWRILLSKQDGEAFNVASVGPEFSVTDLAHAISKLFSPPASVDVRPDAQRAFQAGSARHTRADISKIKRLLDWVPTTDLDAGLRRTLRWHQSQPKTG